MHVTSSGREVPKAMIVMPIINSETPKYLAITTALFTKNSDPKYSPRQPIRK